VKFLLDVCVSSRSLTAFLVAQGHDVLSALAIDPSASDEHLLALALQEDRVLLTEDKDFGELVFVQARPHGPLLRVVELSVDEQVRAVGELLAQHLHELTGPVIVTVTRGRVRIRRRNG
jgi:predicted nuclease of predicted toxin-antitoxin system